jgi:DNA-binding response OmpR family regulator
VRQKILAIDDSPEIHRLLDVRLRTEDIELFHVTEGAEALDKAIEISPDLILLDVVLPTASGFDLCRRLKKIRAPRRCRSSSSPARATRSTKCKASSSARSTT